MWSVVLWRAVDTNPRPTEPFRLRRTRRRHRSAYFGFRISSSEVLLYCSRRESNRKDCARCASRPWAPGRPRARRHGIVRLRFSRRTDLFLLTGIRDSTVSAPTAFPSRLSGRISHADALFVRSSPKQGSSMRSSSPEARTHGAFATASSISRVSQKMLVHGIQISRFASNVQTLSAS
jgi:hypothetical protein